MRTCFFCSFLPAACDARPAAATATSAADSGAKSFQRFIRLLLLVDPSALPGYKRRDGMPVPAHRQPGGVRGSGAGQLVSLSCLTGTTDARPRGLTSEEAARRLAERGPAAPEADTRSYASIVRANVFTVFNLILLVFGVLTLAFGAAADALFLVILVANAAIGIAQEVRAKHALDRLAALVAPTAKVVRDGGERIVAIDGLVVDDLVRAEPGDQIVADGVLEEATGFTVDESVLTGESQAVVREAGEEVRSGSFAVEGAGAYRVTAVGAESYAQRVTGEARTFRHPRSPLERALNRLLLVLVAILVPLSALLAYALWERNTPMRDAVSTSVAAGVTLVPEGLILLTSVTFAMAAVGIARRGALAQQLNAVESLASVDVLCVDKTGTLTEADLRVTDVVPADGDREALERELGRFAASSPTSNMTLAAIRSEFAGEPEHAEAHVPFSSRWRWSGVQLDGTAFVLGAPEKVGAGVLAERAETEAAAGRRVLAFARTTGASLASVDPAGGQTPDSVPLGLVVLAERLRPNVRETVAYFLDQGVA